MKAKLQDDGPGVMPALIVFLATLSALSYGTFLLEHFLSPGLDVINGYVSELSAIDQPYHLVYSSGDLVTGVLCVVIAATALRVLRHRAWATAGWALLLLFGVCVIGDAVFPLDCAPSLETRCALLELAGQVSASHQLHAMTSSAVVLFGVLALLTLSVAARRYGWWPPLARWGWVMAVAEAACGFGTVYFMIRGSWLGMVQRVQIGILCAGLFVIAWALYEDRRRAGRRAEVSEKVS